MSDKTIKIRGKLHWCKLTGEARPYTGNPKYDKGPSWSVDITPDAESLKIIKEAGISDKLREPKGEKETRKESYLTLRTLLLKADGTKNASPSIIDGSGQPWNGANIGNESVADILVKVKDYGTTIGAYLQKVRVLSHVEYEGTDFDPLTADDQFFAAKGLGKAAKESSAFDADLDDDVPF